MQDDEVGEELLFEGGENGEAEKLRGERVPDVRVLGCGVGDVGSACGDVEAAVACLACGVAVRAADVREVGVVFGAWDGVGGCRRVDERVHCEASAESVEGKNVEDVVLVHERLGVGVVPGVVDEVLLTDIKAGFAAHRHQSPFAS